MQNRQGTKKLNKTKKLLTQSKFIHDFLFLTNSFIDLDFDFTIRKESNQTLVDFGDSSHSL